jgi:hypothetical protein
MQLELRTFRKMARRSTASILRGGLNWWSTALSSLAFLLQEKLAVMALSRERDVRFEDDPGFKEHYVTSVEQLQSHIGQKRNTARSERARCRRIPAGTGVLLLRNIQPEEGVCVPVHKMEMTLDAAYSLMLCEEDASVEKKEVSLEAISYPMPCSLVGVTVEGKPNYLTVAWFSMVNFKPPYIMAALGKVHYTNPGIKENGAFSINIPSGTMVEAVDYCGIVSGKVRQVEPVPDIYGKLKQHR